MRFLNKTRWLARLLNIDGSVAHAGSSRDMAERVQLDFELEFYLETYPDLRHLSNEATAKHYRDYGEREGRQASPFAVREGLLGSIGEFDDVLEIGPFFESPN